MTEMPKIGETVTVQFTAEVTHSYPNGNIEVIYPTERGKYFVFVRPEHIVQPKPAWEKVRDAVNELHAFGYHPERCEALLHIAEQMEEEAKPKPTLAEAVRAYAVSLNQGREDPHAWNEVIAALAREEAAKNG